MERLAYFRNQAYMVVFGVAFLFSGEAVVTMAGLALIAGAGVWGWRTWVAMEEETQQRDARARRSIGSNPRPVRSGIDSAHASDPPSRDDLSSTDRRVVEVLFSLGEQTCDTAALELAIDSATALESLGNLADAGIASRQRGGTYLLVSPYRPTKMTSGVGTVESNQDIAGNATRSNTSYKEVMAVSISDRPSEICDMCRNCSAYLLGDEVFCPECGLEIPSSPDALDAVAVPANVQDDGQDQADDVGLSTPETPNLVTPEPDQMPLKDESLHVGSHDAQGFGEPTDEEVIEDVAPEAGVAPEDSIAHAEHPETSSVAEEKDPEATRVVRAISPESIHVAEGASCLACDGLLPPDASFCAVCGTSAPWPVSDVVGRSCSVCGESLPADAHFCGACGGAARDAVATSPEQQMAEFCTGCGIEVKERYPFCGECGTPME